MLLAMHGFNFDFMAVSQEIVAMFRKVVSLFEQNLANPRPIPKGGEASNMTLMAQDLLVLLLSELPQTQCQELWNICVSSSVIGNPDGGIQKRGYRLLSKLVQGGKLANLNVEDVLFQLTARSESVAAPAKRDRITLFALLIDALPNTSLHTIPNLIPETVLTTKEPAERTRSAAFNLIVAMGHKMKEGGTVKRSRLDGMDDESSNEGIAEFLFLNIVWLTVIQFKQLLKSILLWLLPDLLVLHLT